MNSAHHLQTALPQLSIFLAVARHRSFSGAGRELGISTSAVSQAVRQLEATLKIVLLRRTINSTLVCAGVAPGNANLGVMLPYTALHHLLLYEVGVPVAATRGAFLPSFSNQVEPP